MKRILSSLLTAAGFCVIMASFGGVIRGVLQWSEGGSPYWEWYMTYFTEYVGLLLTWGWLPLAVAIFFLKKRFEEASKSKEAAR